MINEHERLERKWKIIEKYNIHEKQLSNIYKTTSIEKLLETLGSLEHYIDTDSDENSEYKKIKKIDYLLKSNLTLKELQFFYGLLEIVAKETFSKFEKFVENEFDKDKEIILEQEEDIKNLNIRLEKYTNTLFD